MRRIAILFLLLASPCLGQHEGTWPGQSGNPVGYSAYGSGVVGGSACPAPTSGTSGNPTIIKNCTYSTAQTVSQSYVWFFQVDFASGTGGVHVSGSHDLFVGCRFQSNQVGFYNVEDTGSANWFVFSSMVPLVSIVTSPPGYSIWPGAESQQNTSTQSNGVNSTNGADGYQYGVLDFPATSQVLDHLDIWGFGNSVDYESGSNGDWLLQSWIHDAAFAGTQGYHTDGPGYLNGASGTAPWNLDLVGNVVESMGNTNALAMQQGSASLPSYSNMQIIRNVWGAFGNTMSPGDISSGVHFTNSPLTQNVFDTSIPPSIVIFHGTTLGTGTVWSCNHIRFATNTSWSVGGYTPVSSNNGKYWVLSNTAPASSTDQGGNTTCAETDPASIDFLTQAPGTTSSAQVIILSNTGTSSLTITSIAPQTGTNFSVSSTTCGASLAASASCTISVKFSPTSATKAVYQDQIQITDSMAGVGSPQIIPLIGIGCDSSCAGSPIPTSPAENMFVMEKP